jgi:hypothetical protein
MRRSGVGAGGGIGMNKNVKVPVRTGSGAHSKNPGWVAQLGQSQGSHVTAESESKYRGDPMQRGPSFNSPVPFGNEKALDVGRGGPGTGRTTHHCGSQSQWGDVAGNPKPAGRQILSEYGPESSRPRNDES